MEDIELQKKAKTHKGKVYLKSLLPKLIEDPRQGLFINTNNSSEIMRMILDNLYITRKDYSKKLNRKEMIQNIKENIKDVEYLCDKNNCSLFTFASDQKKKPMNLVMGILYNKQILDYFEFEVVNFIPISYFSKDIEIDSYMKPVLIFQGEIFETDPNYERLKKFFIDYFRLYNVEQTIISELKRVIVISCDYNTDKIIKIRSYQVNGNISEMELNTIKLDEIGPSLDLKERDFEVSELEKYSKTLKQPRGVKEVKVKNIEKNALGEKRGIIHMQKQNLNAISLRQFKKISKKKRFGKTKPEDGDKDNNKEIDIKE